MLKGQIQEIIAKKHKQLILYYSNNSIIKKNNLISLKILDLRLNKQLDLL